ncbi:phosphotransferase [Yunchengibacter salinarum]|uniref:phosphotransferase n=1 Tax=Yunchengibacter salinarum TaxID=3133399 RepID=UPI0035B5B74A
MTRDRTSDAAENTDPGTRLDRLKAALTRQGAEPAALARAFAAPMATRRGACLYRLTGAARPKGAPPAVIVKLYRPGSARLSTRPMNPSATARQAHMALAALDGMDPPLIPRPLHGASSEAAEDWLAPGAVLMEAVDGPPLARLLWGRALIPAVRRRLMREAGIWLARCHTSAPADERPLGDADPARRLADMAQRAGAAAETPLIRRALAHLAETQAAQTPTPWARQHGDFTPGNLLVTRGGIRGIDLATTSPAPILLDMARFLGHLAVHHPGPNLTPGPLGAPRALSDAFLEGYAGVAPHLATALDTPAARHAALFELTRRWLSLKAQQARCGPPASALLSGNISGAGRRIAYGLAAHRLARALARLLAKSP